MQRPECIDLELVEDAGKVHVFQRLDLQNAGVVDQQIDRLVADGACHGFDRSFVDNIELHDTQPLAVFCSSAYRAPMHLWDCDSRR